MCGISGILNLDGRPVDETLLKRMTRSIAHRGPDGDGFYIKGPVGLGHRRLAIIDLSPRGKQPMCNEDQTIWITYNGEIYNFEEIKAELISKGHVFTSDADTEMVIHAYEEWGVECLQRFNGMFAFALWDENRKRFFLVRDRIGIKPFFYQISPDTITFGSEIKAILPSVEDRDIDYEALAYYLALNYTPAPFTLFKSVHQLLPGHFMLVGMDGEVHIEQYWQLTYQEGDYRSERYYLEKFTELIEDATRIRLMSDVPFGAFLSGGLDSSTVSYWMAQNLQDKLKTFSIGFPEKSFSELEYAQEVADVIGVEQYSRMVDADLAALLPKMVRHAEEPTADSSMVAVYYLSELTREHVTMALSGDGADEIIAGYETYQAYYVHQLYRKLPRFLREKVIMPMVDGLPVSEGKVSWDFKLRRFVNRGNLSSEDAHATWRMIYDAPERAALTKPAANQPGIGANVFDLYRDVFAQTNASHALNRMLYVDTTFYLPNDMLVKVDRMSMAHSLEVRVPFLDHRIVEFMAAVPPNLKLKNYRTKKYLLKAAMKGRLPRRIIHRKKAGFNVPKARWMRQGLKPFVTDHLSKTQIQDMGFLDQKAVQGILTDHFNNKADNSFQIWNLLTLSLWWQEFIQGGVHA